MEHKKSNHSWDEEEIKKYLEQSAEAEEIPPELETENMRKYIKTQTTGEQQKKHKNITRFTSKDDKLFKQQIEIYKN